MPCVLWLCVVLLPQSGEMTEVDIHSAFHNFYTYTLSYTVEIIRRWVENVSGTQHSANNPWIQCIHHTQFDVGTRINWTVETCGCARDWFDAVPFSLFLCMFCVILLVGGVCLFFSIITYFCVWNAWNKQSDQVQHWQISSFRQCSTSQISLLCSLCALCCVLFYVHSVFSVGTTE